MLVKFYHGVVEASTKSADNLEASSVLEAQGRFTERSNN